MQSSSLTPQAFVAKWQRAELKERAGSQEHFIDLCRLLGHPTPAEADPEGEWFTFEAGATKQTGGQGWADVWKRGFFAWEYKGQHANLDKAYDQLLLYRGALQNPPLLIVSDMQTIRIHTNFINTVKTVHDLSLEDLLDPARLALLRYAFFEPERLKAPQTPEQVTQQAAAEFARLAEDLRKYTDAPDGETRRETPTLAQSRHPAGEQPQEAHADQPLQSESHLVAADPQETRPRRLRCLRLGA